MSFGLLAVAFCRMPGEPSFGRRRAGYDEQAVAKFYRGKTVTIVVGHSAGGFGIR